MDADKIKDFFLYNFEKFIVAVVVGLAGFLIYSGLGKDDITQTIQPDVLEQSAKAVRLEVDEDHSEFVEERKPEFEIDVAMEKRTEPIPGDRWAQKKPWIESGPETTGKKRSDPAIAQAVSVQVQGLLVSIAARSTDGNYMIKDLEAADALEVEAPKPERKPRGRGRNSGMDMMDMMDMEGYGSGMDSGYEDMMMETTMDVGGGGSVRRLPPEADEGMRPVTEKHIITNKDQPPVPQTGYFIAGTVAVPHKQIAEAYKAAFADAAEYDPRRDQPRYLDFQLQRADVTGKTVDQLQESDWVNRDDKRTTTIDAATWWCGYAPEFVPSEYLIPGVTMWIPPVLLDDYKKFSSHPLVPLVSQRQMLLENTNEDDEATGPLIPDAEIFEAVTAGGGNSGRSGYGGGEEYGMEMMDEMGSYEDMGTGSYGSGFGGASQLLVEKNPVDHKLLRFYDWAIDPRPDPNSPKPNRSYVYRVRFAVEDPNFPEKRELQPKGRYLSPAVYSRVVALQAKEAQEEKRDFKMWSEWSQPSAPVMLPKSDRFYVGDVKPLKLRRGNVGGRTVMIESEAPSAEMIISNFNSALGAYVPVMTEVTEGSILSEKAEVADVVDPITLEVKKVPDVEITSSATVIDIDGGDPLSIAEGDEMRVPGMFLIMDAQGNLVVRDAVEEQKTFRLKSFAKERGK